MGITSECPGWTFEVLLVVGSSSVGGAGPGETTAAAVEESSDIGSQMTMGFPGDNEREMSVENNSPVSAELPKSEQIFKKQRANGHSDSNSMTNNVGGAGSKVSGGDKAAAADVSSEDIDVTSMGENEPSANSRLAGGAASGSGGTASPKKQDPLLKGRLKLIRIHVIGALFKHPKSQPFREPVDAKALGIYPLYHQIVKTPMDLGTVRKKIDRGAYRSREECVSDIEQVWTNGMTFNAAGHFVHEAAKLLRGIAQDKLSRLAKDEAAGKYKDVLDAVVMGAKPRQPKQQPPKQPSLAPALGLGPDSDLDTPSREARKRAVRKVSVDLPGEHTPPQHLKKKYVENLSGQMKQCDDILRELMTSQKSRCEPFLRIPRAAYGGMVDPIDLYKIQSKLQAGYYRHPLHFANDFRRMITETYRYSVAPQMSERAAELQHQFELRFSHIDYEPVDDTSIYDDSSAAAEEESFLHQLSSATAQIAAIQENVTRLLKDSIHIRQAKRRAAGGKGAPPPGGHPAAPATPRKRGRPKTASASSGGGNEPKRQRAAAGKKGPAAETKGRGGNSAVAAAAVSIDESIELRDLVSTLTEDQQQRIVQIMMENNETLTTDAEGFTEIELGNCSAKTVQDVQSYIRQAKATEAAAASVKAAATKKTPSPNKNRNRQKQQQQQQQRNGNLTDSSSDSSGDEGDSSSGSSSSSDDSDVDSLVD